MSSARYRKLLTNLPSMAAVVNSFQSPDVQIAVYQSLIESLEEASVDDSPKELKVEISPARSNARRASIKNSKSEDSALADIVEGDSIHSMAAD